MADQAASDSARLTRRSLLGAGAAGAAGLAAGVAVPVGVAGRADAATSPSRVSAANARRTVPFYGRHQAGVVTDPPAHATLVAFDLLPGVDREALARLFAIWTDDAARLTRGEPGLADTEPELATYPAGLTITVAVGAGAVRAAGREVPPWLEGLPAFAIDALEPRWSGGDLLVQFAGDEALSVAHAVRLLTKDARTFVQVRWVQRGFRGTPGSTGLPRNLMGQIDGTGNPPPADLERLVWGRGLPGLAQPAWLRGGTTMVVRRIAMALDTWDQLSRRDRERTIGRTLDNGAPLSGGGPKDRPDLDARDDRGFEVIDPFAHVRRAATKDPDQRFLRRPYSFDDPPPAGALSDSGLIFITFQADVEHQFVPIQQRLSDLDLLNEWTTPVGSGVFAVLPGARPDVPLGAALTDLTVTDLN